jgi:Ca2+-binding RTX toxin-like protein
MKRMLVVALPAALLVVPPAATEAQPTVRRYSRVSRTVDVRAGQPGGTAVYRSGDAIAATVFNTRDGRVDVTRLGSGPAWPILANDGNDLPRDGAGSDVVHAGGGRDELVVFGGGHDVVLGEGGADAFVSAFVENLTD